MIYIMGTGSRSMLTHPDRKMIYANLETHIMNFAMFEEITLITGMAEGWDEAIAKVGMRNDIPYIAYVPHPTYGDYYWGRKSLTGKNRLNTFHELLAHATETIVISQHLYVNGQHVNFLRNQWMVDACDMAVVYDSQSRGTRDAVARLKMADKPYQVYPF